MGTEETKKALLDAAKQLIAENGYSAVSVRNLAAAAGTSISAINYHFGSRERLLSDAILGSFVDWAESVGSVSSRLASVDANAGPLEHMAAQARPILAEFPARLPRFAVGLEALLQAQRSPELREQLAIHYAKMRRLASEFILEGTSGYDRSFYDEPPPRMVEVAASFMLATIDGLMLQALIDPEATPTGDELAAFYEGLAAVTRVTGPSASAPASETAGSTESTEPTQDGR